MRNWSVLSLLLLSTFLLFLLPSSAVSGVTVGQTQTSGRSPTPVEMEIEKQRQRLNSPDMEERRDALMRLRALRRPEASRAARSALNDPSPTVRAAAAHAAVAHPSEESVAALIPLLNDKDEFVAREAAYALGKTQSKSAIAPLVGSLTGDRRIAVRAAAVVALGQLRDEAAVVPLAEVLQPQVEVSGSAKKGKDKNRDNGFLLRTAAHSLGQIGSRAAVPALIAVVQREAVEEDVRREAVVALGLIGDPAAVPTLRSILVVNDPYLSLSAHEALRKIASAEKSRRSGKSPA